MKKWWLLAGVFVFAGCGLFSEDGDDPFDIEIKESVDFEFTVDSADLCPPGEDCSVDAMPSPGPIDTPPIEVPFPVNIIEATGNQELADVAGRLKRVEIESVDYEIIPNSLNIPSPELQIWVGPKGALTRNDNGTVHLMTIPSAMPMEEKTGSVPTIEESVDPASEHFLTLDFNTIGFADDDIEQGELFPPQGEAKYKVTMNLKFVANPKDQL